MLYALIMLYCSYFSLIICCGLVDVTYFQLAYGGFKGRGVNGAMPSPPNLAPTSSRRGHLTPPEYNKTF